MSKIQKNWIWFILILVLIAGGGFYLGHSRRAELGKSFNYSLDDYRSVDAAFITYKETQPLNMGLDPQQLGSIAIDSNGAVYVTGDDAIAVRQSRLGKPEIVSVLGRPSCIAVDDEKTVFVGMNDHVEVFFSPSDRMVWDSPGPKAYLTSIAVDDEFVFVADAGSRCVWRYPKNGGEPLRIESERGFFIPSPFFDLALGPDGSLWVVNPGHHAFENIRADGSLISSWEKTSMQIEGFSGCCNPSHFALMPDGAFVTAEKGLPRVKIHNLDGSLRCVVAAPDQFDDDVTGLDVAVDDQGRIYVLDPSRNVVRVFEEKNP